MNQPQTSAGHFVSAARAHALASGAPVAASNTTVAVPPAKPITTGHKPTYYPGRPLPSVKESQIPHPSPFRRKPKLGDIGIMRTPGFGAWWIRFFEALGGQPHDVNHAVLYVGGGMCVSCEPKGAKLRPIKRFPGTIWSQFDLKEAQRVAIAHWAYEHIGTPYNFLDLAAIAWTILLGKLHLPIPRFVQHRLERTDRLQCAQLCDDAYQFGPETPVHIFEGEIPYAVTPGEFERLYRDRGWYPYPRHRKEKP